MIRESVVQRGTSEVANDNSDDKDGKLTSLQCFDFWKKASC